MSEEQAAAQRQAATERTPSAWAHYPPMTQRHHSPPWYAHSAAGPGQNVQCGTRGASIGLLTTFVAGNVIATGDRVLFDDEGKAYRA